MLRPLYAATPAHHNFTRPHNKIYGVVSALIAAVSHPEARLFQQFLDTLRHGCLYDLFFFLYIYIGGSGCHNGISDMFVLEH